MTQMKISNPIFASRLRKKFNKKHISFSIGDLVRTHEGNIGKFQGISTYSNHSQITVLLYKTDTKNGMEIYELPNKFSFLGHDIPVHFQLSDSPEIIPQSYGRSRYGYY